MHLERPLRFNSQKRILLKKSTARESLIEEKPMILFLRIVARLEENFIRHN